MITKEIKIRVRYKETDKMGIVHHSNYVNYYEVARTEMLRSYGISYRQMEEQGIMLPVRQVTMDYFAPAHYDDLLSVRISLKEPPGVKLVFDHEIRNEQGELLNTGRVVLVFTHAATRKPCRAPEWFVQLYERESAKAESDPADTVVL